MNWYGSGENVRDWLYVDDHCTALLAVFERGNVGHTYTIGGESERTNLQVVQAICAALDGIRPRQDGRSYAEQITFVEDRPGHDFRYAIDPGKIKSELNWRPSMTFEAGLKQTIDWYLKNQKWCDRIHDGTYRGERLGTLG